MKKYTHRKPTVAGWYWCRNRDPQAPSGIWEAIVRIEQTSKGLFCLWLHGENKTPDGRVGLMHESDWSEETLWCGPLVSPDSEDASAIPVHEIQCVRTLESSHNQSVLGVGIEAKWMGRKEWVGMTQDGFSYSHNIAAEFEVLWRQNKDKLRAEMAAKLGVPVERIEVRL